jgi:hypothetical protein
LADSKDVDTLSTELENRLDDLFGDNNVAPPDEEENDVAAHYPLAELKNLILSIDWEITDEVLGKFLQQIKDLKLTYKHDKIVLTREMPEMAKKKILRAEMIRYKELRAQISQSKSAAQPTPKAKPARAEKPEVVMETGDQPVTLTEPTVQPSEAEISETPVIEPEQEPDVVTLREPSIETLAEAVADIKKYIHDEIGALKKEIKALQNQ